MNITLLSIKSFLIRLSIISEIRLFKVLMYYFKSKVKCVSLPRPLTAITHLTHCLVNSILYVKLELKTKTLKGINDASTFFFF